MINENRHKNRQKALLNKTFIQLILCKGLRCKGTERLASNLKKFPVNYEANLSTFATHLRSMFFKPFPKTLRDTTNQSIRIVFQHKFTIKPVIICVFYSQEHSNITMEVRGF